jgi:hypothetical protein
MTVSKERTVLRLSLHSCRMETVTAEDCDVLLTDSLSGNRKRAHPNPA